MPTTSQSPVQLPPAPPAAPRELTAAALRRSLAEPTVRFWWLAGLVLLAVAVFFLITQMLNWSHELKIVRQGTTVTATIEHIGEGEVSGVGNMPPDTHVDLSYTYNGQSYAVDGFLEGRRDPIDPKEKISIRIDPDDPGYWTYLTEAPPILHGVLAFLLVIPFSAALLAVSWALRRRYLRIWRNGEASPFVVETAGQSALAPASKVVSCKDMRGRTARLVRVFVPRRVAELKAGDTLWLIHPPAKLETALAAIAYM